MRSVSIFSVLFFLFSSLKGFTQVNDSTAKFTISGYADAYYAYYTDSAAINDFQKFPSVSPRSNQFGLNTAQVSLQYDANKVRGIVTLHFGDIPKSAWSSTYNNIMEAHAGFRLCKKLWLDAGFFRTHFGTEGLLPKENITSSVSVNTFYEPYLEAGVRLNFVPNDKWAINLFVLNGYNTFEDNNKKKSIGMLVTYAPSNKVNWGYSNYVGDDSSPADSISHLRIHQNLFFNYQRKKIKIQAGGDFCMQENTDVVYLKNITATMFSGIISFRYQVKEKYAMYTRVEGFHDRQGFMSGVILDKENKLTGYKLYGITVGAEYKFTDNSYIRIEGRQLQMDKNQEIFYWNGKPRSQRMELLCNVGISF